jgi:hypothetical protein
MLLVSFSSSKTTHWRRLMGRKGPILRDDGVRQTETVDPKLIITFQTSSPVMVTEVGDWREGEKVGAAPEDIPRGPGRRDARRV